MDKPLSLKSNHRLKSGRPSSSMAAVQQEGEDTLSSADLDWMMVTAFVYLQNHHYEKSIALLEAALSFDKNNVEALKQLSYAYLITRRYRETLVVCEKIYDLTVERNIDVAPVYLIQSYALLGMDQKEQAKDWLLKYQSFLGPQFHG